MDVWRQFAYITIVEIEILLTLWPSLMKIKHCWLKYYPSSGILDMLSNFLPTLIDFQFHITSLELINAEWISKQICHKSPTNLVALLINCNWNFNDKSACEIFWLSTAL